MKKEKSNIKFKDLFSEYEHRKGIRERPSELNNEGDSNTKGNVRSNPLGSENLLNLKLSKIWSFLNTPIENLTNKKENKTNSLKLLNEYQHIYKIFKVFQRDDIKINNKEIFKKMLYATSSVTLIAFMAGLLLSTVITILLGISFIGGMWLFYQKNDDLNGINEEILYRKYKTYLLLMLHMKPYLKEKEDMLKLMTVMSKNNDVDLPNELIEKYSNMAWNYISKVDEVNIPELSKLSEDETIALIYENFKGLLANRNSAEKNSKEWDDIVEIFNHEGIEKDLKTFENINLLQNDN